MNGFDFEYFKALYGQFSYHSCKELEKLYITWNGENYGVEAYNSEHDDIADVGDNLSDYDGYIDYSVCYRIIEDLECEIDDDCDENVQTLMDDVLKSLPPTSNMNAFTVTSDGDYGVTSFLQEYRRELDNDGIKYVIDNLSEIQKQFPDHRFELYKLNIDETTWNILKNVMLDEDDLQHKSMFIYFK